MIVWINRGGYIKNKKVYGEEDTEKNKKSVWGVRCERKVYEWRAYNRSMLQKVNFEYTSKINKIKV